MSRATLNVLTIAVILIVPALVGCSPVQISTNQPIDAINETRTALELPDLAVEFVEMTGMINSPNGDLEVAMYQDTDERKYFVNPETNQVVEIDARVILPGISPDAPALTTDELRTRALEYIRAAIPDFESLESLLQYEEGAKGNNFFFAWYGEVSPGSMNRPFAQIGLHQSGVLFAYYNTLLLEK